MHSADMFAYLAAFVTILLALALGDMVQSTHRLLRAHKVVRWDIVAVMAAVVVFLSLLSEFFVLWDEIGVARYTYYELVWLVINPLLVALAALSVLPDDVPSDGLDMREYYFDHRKYLYSVLALQQVTDLIRKLMWGAKVGALDNPQFWWYVPMVGAWLAAFIVLAWSRSARVHLIVLVLLIGYSQFAYAPWSIELPTAPTNSTH